jgi:hypothetical protein
MAFTAKQIEEYENFCRCSESSEDALNRTLK